MNKLALAQALVPIADDLDERGFEEELAELDEIIEQLAAEAQVEAKMTKAAQTPSGYGQGLPTLVNRYTTDPGTGWPIDPITKLPIINKGESQPAWYDRVRKYPQFRDALKGSSYRSFLGLGKEGAGTFEGAANLAYQNMSKTRGNWQSADQAAVAGAPGATGGQTVATLPTIPGIGAARQGDAQYNMSAQQIQQAIDQHLRQIQYLKNTLAHQHLGRHQQQ